MTNGSDGLPQRRLRYPSRSSFNFPIRYLFEYRSSVEDASGPSGQSSVTFTKKMIMGGFVYKFWLVACVLALLPLRLTAQETPLVVGILPTLSPRVLLTNYQPFRAYLEETLKRPVELVTATDLPTFHKSTMAGAYDVVVTAAHLGRYAQMEGGYLPLAGYKLENRAILIVSKNNPLKSIGDLRGHKVATLSRMALVAQQSRDWLDKQGLQEGADYQLIETSSQVSSAYSVQSGESKLAILAPTGWKQLPDNIRDSIQIYATLPAIPSLIWMANPRMTRAAPRLKSALLAFSTELPAGKQFFEVSGYQAMREMTASEMKSLDVYLPYLKQHLGQ